MVAYKLNLKPEKIPSLPYTTRLKSKNKLPLVDYFVENVWILPVPYESTSSLAEIFRFISKNFGGIRSVMVTVVKNEYGDMSLNPGRNVLGTGMNPTIHTLAMGK